MTQSRLTILLLQVSNPSGFDGFHNLLLTNSSDKECIKNFGGGDDVHASECSSQDFVKLAQVVSADLRHLFILPLHRI